MSVSELCIPTIDLPILLQENNMDRSWKLGLRPRNSQKRNTCMGFSLQCSTTGLYELDKKSKTFGLSFPLSQGLINYKETKTKCRLYWYLIEFIDWRYNQQCWYFWPNFVNYCLYNLLSGSLPPPPPKVKVQYILYRQCMDGKGGGCCVMLETISCRSLTLCFWRENLQNCYTTPNKNLGGEGASDR